MELSLLALLSVGLVCAVFVGLLGWQLLLKNRQLHHLRQQMEQSAQEFQRLQTELKIAKDKADDAQQANTAFLASMIQELGDHLNVISGYSQIFHREHRLNKQQLNAINVIHRHSEHLLLLLDEILDFAHLEARQITLENVPFHLRRMLSGLAELTRPQTEQRGIAFTTDFANDLPKRVRSDERRLRQILLTLLNNAVKFTNKGSIMFRVVTCDTFAPVHGLRFQVEDTGIGIPPEHVADIFLPFHLVKNTTLYREGTRLGLAISRQLVHLMGGDLKVMSTPRRGTLFWFDIPLSEAVEAESPEQEKIRQIVGFKGPLRKLLIADDTYDNRAILKEMLLPLGFEIIEAVDGFDVLTKAAQHRPDLILLDLTMPVLNGFEAIRHIRQMPIISEVCVVGMSASVLRQLQEENTRAGGNDFLVKPIQFEDLLECLQRHLELEWIYMEDVAEAENASEKK